MLKSMLYRTALRACVVMTLVAALGAPKKW